MSRYEYKIFDSNSVRAAGPEAISAMLTELGLAGWRFVAVIAEDVMGMSGHRYAAPPALLFEREVEGCIKCQHFHCIKCRHFHGSRTCTTVIDDGSACGCEERY
jgi:hypothetical protein